MTPTIPGADLVFDAEFREKVRAAAFGAKLKHVEDVPPDPEPEKRKQTDARSRAEIQAELRAGGAGTRGRQL